MFLPYPKPLTMTLHAHEMDLMNNFTNLKFSDISLT